AELRIGLVAYRDVGDDYVTRDFALTGDLDAVFAELSGYQADGGGDTPEDVAAALDDTLHRMQWRGDARKLVFLVGDAPPADDGERAVYQRNLAANAAAPAASKADRAAYYATGSAGPAGGARASNDLVGGVLAGKMRAGKVAKTALPPDLRGLSPEELQAEIQ